ncbi:MAG: glycosyltransferase [Acidobacteriota bacterium]|nr:glycosyltransferase [Acidobacteriota bacterium]
MAFLSRLLRALPLLLISPFILVASILALAIMDLFCLLLRKPIRSASDTRPQTGAASIVIPNWNGRDLLAKYLPSVTAAARGNPENEIIVVENGSTDGSADFLTAEFPSVRVLALPRNLGFGGGSNAGFRAAKNDIVVLLNSDMRVAPDFLGPLLAGFTDSQVFAVSCQIFLSDRTKRREETGLTQGWWQDGGLKVSHREDDAVDNLYPCFYGGGGSCAFDRRKFLELGGFDDLFAPFYLEDTDLGYMAWKRGWKVLYQPKSVVHHEHRGTIGKTFSDAHIQAVLKKNFILFCWKNIHDWRKLLANFSFTNAGALLSVALGEEPGRANFSGLWRAFVQLPGALRSRARSRGLARIDDREAFARTLGAHFRDRFRVADELPNEPPSTPRVLFVSPYPILPPVHGGGLFMYETLRELSKLVEVHALVMLDHAPQLEANLELRELCASAEFFVRLDKKQSQFGSILPHAIHEFRNADVQWLIHRQVYQKRIDVVQLDYTALGQYVDRYQRLASVLFEHDIYFQSIGRGLEYMRSPLDKIKARLEYLRAIRYELRMLPRCDRIQVCTRENREYLESFLPGLSGRIQEGLRAGISTSRYPYPGGPREPFTMLFLGSFRHVPNQVALEWFARQVLPLVLAKCPGARLFVAGSDPPPRHAYADASGAIEMLGFVEDIQPLFSRCAVFVCPILSGSGVRVKLLEAFASGIPVVSTYIGAEGLARVSGEFCYLSDDPAEFAKNTAEVLEAADGGAAMASRARGEVVANWDMAVLTRRLVASYEAVLREKRTSASAALRLAR